MSKAMFASILLLTSVAAVADSQIGLSAALLNCKAIADPAEKLNCFESIPLTEAAPAASSPEQAKVDAKQDNALLELAPEDASFLERKWRLSKSQDSEISAFESYKSNYLLVSTTGQVNNIPVSPTRANGRDRDLNSQDVKFQISFKTELAKDIPLIDDLPYVTSSRIWIAYTQKSFWQFFSAAHSRPFRENNYEPEVILSLGLDNKGKDGIRKAYLPRMLNLGLVHQSNGQSNPLSRSWNRLYLQGGWDLSDQLTLMVRPWWRIPESNQNDDNPDLQKYLGYGDLSLRWENATHKTAATLLLRDNLRSDNKGFLQFDLQRQVFEDHKINLHLMFSTGYGDSLLDYNHAQNTLGFGISLGE